MSMTAPPARGASALLVVTVFTSAALVFTVEPLIARLILPVLGGSAAVWNTSLAFFQAALLAGYLYAHALARLTSLKAQIAAHAAALILAALALPLGVSRALGDPAPGNPSLWLLGTLTISLGAPFAALSATAPLIQAWRARTRPGEARGPWALYAASNLGSLLALLAYPVVVETLLPLHSQTAAWSVGYLVFVALMLTLGASLWRRDLPGRRVAASRAVAIGWLDRGRWIALAAVPSSLMLGVTTHITTDVGSAPFLWVAPLALYLATFIVAFQDRPWISRRVALFVQAGAVLAAVAFLRPGPGDFLQGLAVHLTAFFFTALICHQALVARRPDPARLTEFYIFMSLGGVIGGAFNAFAAPAIFNTAIEYPAALILACLARPWGQARGRWVWILASTGCVTAVGAAAFVAHPPAPLPWISPGAGAPLSLALVSLAAILAFCLRARAWPFALAVLLVALGAARAADRQDVLAHWRSFFGVLTETRVTSRRLGGDLHMLAHGTTLHGAQATAPAFRCRPLVYYAHETPIGQVFDAEQAARPAVDIGAVGLGTGTIAAYSRASDRLRFFEIDPLVARVSTDPRNFSYIGACAKGPVAITLGDARLTLSRTQPASFDILLIDAFSSDSVPTHLLTVEAMKLYLSRLKPDGVIVLHLTNRNLDLAAPAQATAAAAGGVGLFQRHRADPLLPPLWEANEDALIVAKSPAAIAAFAHDPRWRSLNSSLARPWTDDRSDLFGAMIARIEERWR